MRLSILMPQLLLQLATAKTLIANEHEKGASIRQINDSMQPPHYRKRDRPLQVRGEKQRMRRQLVDGERVYAYYSPHEYRAGTLKSLLRKRKRGKSGESRESAKIQKHFKKNAESAISGDESFLNEQSELVEVTDTGLDTSHCENSIHALVGETVSADATHQIDPNSIEDCQGGFELNNPFVEVLGMWFTVGGTGGILKASSCPGLLSVYHGGDCDTLMCALGTSYNAQGCHVEWQSSPLGQVDYILVQSIELNEGGEGHTVPIMLTIKAGNATVAEEEEATQSSGGGNNNEFDLNNEMVIVNTTHLSQCQGAELVTPGSQVLASAASINGTVDECGHKFSLDGFDVPILGAWFTIAGTGGTLKASACPSRITVFQGSNCSKLACAVSTLNDLECEAEWTSSKDGQFDFILVQTIGFEDEAEGFTLPVTLTIVDPADAEVDPSPDTQANATDANKPQGTQVTQANASDPNEPKGTQVAGDEVTEFEAAIKSNVEGCKNADEIQINDSIPVPLDIPLATFLHCRSGLYADDLDGSVLGSWFTMIGGDGRALRASACPGALISVYEGGCDGLQCVPTKEVGNSTGCEVLWRSDRMGGQQHILVRTLHDTATIESPLQLLIEEA